MKLRTHTLFILALLFLFQFTTVHAEKYYRIPLNELSFKDNPGNAFNVSVTAFPQSERQAIQFPRIAIADKESHAYIVPEEGLEDNRWVRQGQNQLQVAFQLQDSEPIVGTVYLVGNNSDTSLKFGQLFTFDPEDAEEITAEKFQTMRESYYARLAYSTIPGGDWFRYRAGDAYRADNRNRRWRNLGEFDSSFNMFTGQRAVSENLALNRELILGESESTQLVPVDSIKGVTVPPVDWSERIEQGSTPIDPLAMVIPEDQHAVFFDSIKDFNKTLKSVEQNGISFLSMETTRETYKNLAQKYQRQMGILLPEILAEQLPVKSMAITGGDPFLPSGSDLCIIFETDSPQTFFVAMNAMIAAQANQSGKEISPEIETGSIQYINKDRSFSSVLFSGEGYVAVANSPKQMERLRKVGKGETKALGTLDEFKFFRQRYPLKDEATAFVFLSDATIRRWAGPTLRIGASRRVRAAAVLGQATAQIIDGTKPTESYSELTGDLSSKGNTIYSEKFNTLDFLTPISELEIKTVTPAEQAGYVRWRNGYENGWVRFDPIGVTLSVEDDSLKVDLSVIPLRVGSRYNDWIRIAGDASLDKAATTPHPDAIAMFSFAVDTSSDSFQMVNRQSSSMLPGIGANPLAWVAGSLSIFLDANPFWVAMATSEDPEDYIKENLNRLPVGLRVSSKSPLKLAMFLTTLRSFSEQAAPGLLQWENREHGESRYVVIRTTSQARLPGDMEIEIHYAALPQAFILSLNENVLKQAIDREILAAENNQTNPSLTQQMYAQAELNTLESYLALMGEYPLEEQQYTSWAALPILNEWHRLFPEEDPIEIHARYFKERIGCPGGQGYRWNPDLGSMESVVFGHPRAPKGEIQNISLFENWTEAEVNISFKDNELRVAGELTR